MKAKQMREQNRLLKSKIQQQRQRQRVGPGLRTQIQKFVAQSKRNIKQMNERSISQQKRANEKLHQITQKYENVLKQQIRLLTQNKELSQKKDQQDGRFNEQVQKITKQYQTQIAQFQKKVKINVKKIQQMGGGNIINKLVKNVKFKAAMAERGCNLQGLEKQSQLEEIAEIVQEKQKEIQTAEAKSSALDQQLQKMHQLMQTMKELMQNMQKQKENILKQNSILKEKLQQSQGLIGKLLGNNQTQQPNQEDQGSQQQQKVNDQ